MMPQWLVLDPIGAAQLHAIAARSAGPADAMTAGCSNP